MSKPEKFAVDEDQIRFYYWVSNCILAINTELPEVQSSIPCAMKADWVIDAQVEDTAPTVAEWDKVWQQNDGEIWMGKRRESSTSFRISYPDYADFLISEPEQHIQVQIRPETAPATWRHLLLDQVMPIILSESGEVVLHGAASQIQNSAVAFVAPSGSGKSTMAMSLLACGHPLVSDDYLRLDFSDGVQVWPSYAGSRLHEDSRRFLGLDSTSVWVAEYTEKLRLQLKAQDWSQSSIPLRAILLLKTGTGPRLEPLNFSQAVLELTQSVFRQDFSRQESTKQFWDRLCHLVREVPVFNLVYPREFDSIRDCHKLIVNLVSGS